MSESAEQPVVGPVVQPLRFKDFVATLSDGDKVYTKWLAMTHKYVARSAEDWSAHMDMLRYQSVHTAEGIVKPASVAGIPAHVTVKQKRR